jgi:hypothetical protein
LSDIAFQKKGDKIVDLIVPKPQSIVSKRNFKSGNLKIKVQGFGNSDDMKETQTPTLKGG